MKLSSSFLQTEGMWEVSFVPLEWCSENKNEYIHQAVLQLFHTAPFWLHFKYGNPVDAICSCECSICKKWERVFYILLYVFLYLRTNFGGPFSSVVTGTGNFVCLLVCWHYYTNVSESVPSTSFSKSLKAAQNALRGQVMLCSASLWSKGRFVGWVSVSQLSCTAPTWGSGTLHKVILCGWRKDNTVLISIVNSFLWPGAYWFLQSQHLINLLLERRCVCAIFSSIAVSKGRKAKDSLGTIKHFSLVSCMDWVFEAIDL